MRAALVAITCLAAAVVIFRSVCTLNRLHWTTHGHGYSHFLGFGLSYVILAAGALVAAIDALHGAISLAGQLVTLASAGLIVFDKRGPRR
jgi:hypothetical protein